MNPSNAITEASAGTDFKGEYISTCGLRIDTVVASYSAFISVTHKILSAAPSKRKRNHAVYSQAIALIELIEADAESLDVEFSEQTTQLCSFAKQALKTSNRAAIVASREGFKQLRRSVTRQRSNSGIAGL